MHIHILGICGTFMGGVAALAEGDRVEWTDKACAEAAATKVQADPAFAPYMAAITGVTLMQHFETTPAIASLLKRISKLAGPK